MQKSREQLGGSLKSLEVIPVPKPRMTRSDRWKRRPAVLKYWSFCERLRDEFGNCEVPERIHLVFYVPMPKSWSDKKKSAMSGLPHQQKPDLDNYVKAFLDALLQEDKHVYEISASKFWSHKGKILVRNLNAVGSSE